MAGNAVFGYPPGGGGEPSRPTYHQRPVPCSLPSQQHDLLGINLYPFEQTDDWIEFDSMINVRPAQGNRSRSVEDATLRTEIARIARALVTD